jgi:Rrf2 family protein
MAILRKAELVTAERGRSGGFSLAKEPADITLFEVITALGGPIINPDHCEKFAGQKEACVHKDNCSVHEILGGLAGYIQVFLSGTTLADLIDPSSRNRIRANLISPESLLMTPAGFNTNAKTENHKG